MRVRVSVVLLALCAVVGVASAQTVPNPELKGSYWFERGGWTYVHLEGDPHAVGFQHGYLLKDQIEDNLNVYRIEAVHLYGSNWQFFRDAGENVLWPKVEPSIARSCRELSDGMQRARIEGGPVGHRGAEWRGGDLAVLSSDGECRRSKPNPPAATAPGKCSAFIATGSATEGWKIVIAHSNWSRYAEGERWTMVYDIVPEHGQRILMDGTPGVITSQDDFGMNAAGLMITETTLPHGQGIRRERHPGVCAIAQGDAVCDIDRRVCAIMRKGIMEAMRTRGWWATGRRARLRTWNWGCITRR